MAAVSEDGGISGGAAENAADCESLAEKPVLSCEFDAVVPPGVEFEVYQSARAGRFMTASTQLGAGTEFLIESPLAAWPLTAQTPEASGSAASSSCPAYGPTWCEGCLQPLGGLAAVGSATGLPSEGHTSEDEGGRRVKRRVAGQGSTSVGGAEPNLCPGCSASRHGTAHHAAFLPPDLLAHWRAWQAARSPNSCVGIEALARCLAQVAATARRVRDELGIAGEEALGAALGPFERLAGPPEGCGVELHGTSAGEVSAELARPSAFQAAVRAAVGSEHADLLLSEASVDWLAGRLILNSCGMEVPGAAADGGPLRAAGVFVFLSTMNHSCSPSAEAVFTASSEVSLRTLRDVAAGEPLTLSYIGLDDAVAERRRRLRHWFFDCDCMRCEAESSLEGALAAAA